MTLGNGEQHECKGMCHGVIALLWYEHKISNSYSKMDSVTDKITHPEYLKYELFM